MTTLSQLYNQKEKNGSDTTTRKTFLVPLAELYVEPGFNVREIDQEHVIEFRDAFIAGELIPPLAVQVTEQGVRIVDGHHRYYARWPLSNPVPKSLALSAKTSLVLKPIVSRSWSRVARENP